jgi:hypothetical protein
MVTLSRGKHKLVKELPAAVAAADGMQSGPIQCVSALAHLLLVKVSTFYITLFTIAPRVAFYPALLLFPPTVMLLF